jgi:hypothetical protein
MLGRTNHIAVKQQNRLWKGLERFANTDDGIENYRSLGKAFPTLWPLPFGDWDPIPLPRAHDAAWSAAAWPIFRFYRDALRRFWVRDPNLFDNLSDPERVNLLTELLLGTFTKWDDIFSGKLVFDVDFFGAIEALKSAYPGIFVSDLSVASITAEWKSGEIRHEAKTDFQRVMWLLFLEPWRSKRCPPPCGIFFVATKKPQLYCSISCSSRAHRQSALAHWNKIGAARRRSAKRKRGR